MTPEILTHLQDFLEAEGRSCSMEPSLITPMYVYRMWGGSVPLPEIEAAMKELSQNK